MQTFNSIIYFDLIFAVFKLIITFTPFKLFRSIMNIYVVTQISGEYESREEHPIAWFFYEDQADEYAKKANDVFYRLKQFYYQKARISNANAVLAGKNEYNNEYYSLICKAGKFECDFAVYAVPQKPPVRYVPPKPEPVIAIEPEPEYYKVLNVFDFFNFLKNNDKNNNPSASGQNDFKN